MLLQINKKAITVAILAIFAVSLISVVFLYLDNQGIQSHKIESIAVAIPPLEQNALLYVAANQGFFVDNGLNVTIKNYDSGLTCINALLDGEVSIAESSEFPFVKAICDNSSISVITVNDEFENDYIVCLTSHGIETVSDLKGKTIGVAKGTIAEFYLGRFLELNGVSVEDVNIINVAPNEYLNAATNGTVDALAAWQPYINQIQGKVDGVVTWQIQNGQEVYGVLVCSDGWLTQHPDTVEHFLKALEEAENYALYNPDKARDVIENELNYTDSYVANVWSKHSYLLSLDQSLVIAMKDEAQWMINNKLTSLTQVPNFINYIYADGLKAISPDSVTIIK